MGKSLHWDSPKQGQMSWALSFFLQRHQLYAEVLRLQGNGAPQHQLVPDPEARLEPPPSLAAFFRARPPVELR